MKLVKNPFFITAILVVLFGITALIIYLMSKKKQSIPSADAPNADTRNPILGQSGANTTTTSAPSTLSPVDREIIALSSPYQKSSKIKKLQKALNNQGYKLTLDSVYGQITHNAAVEAYPNFLSDGQISSDELAIMLDTAEEYNSYTSWTRPAISKTGETIASIVGYVAADTSYEATADAQSIKEAFSWFNDDEAAIEKVLYRLSKPQIAQLLLTFQANYNQALDDFLTGGLLTGLNDTEYDKVLSIVRSRK